MKTFASRKTSAPLWEDWEADQQAFYMSSMSAFSAAQIHVSLSALKPGPGKFRISKALAMRSSRPSGVKCLALSWASLPSAAFLEARFAIRLYYAIEICPSNCNVCLSLRRPRFCSEVISARLTALHPADASLHFA
jgi:hypothetical protein